MPIRSQFETEQEWLVHLRLYFAGQALVSVYDNGGRYGDSGMKQVAEYSYKMADAMIAERNK